MLVSYWERSGPEESHVADPWSEISDTVARVRGPLGQSQVAILRNLVSLTVLLLHFPDCRVMHGWQEPFPGL